MLLQPSHVGMANEAAGMGPRKHHGIDTGSVLHPVQQAGKFVRHFLAHPPMRPSVQARNQHRAADLDVQVLAPAMCRCHLRILSNRASMPAPESHPCHLHDDLALGPSLFEV